MRIKDDFFEAAESKKRLVIQVPEWDKEITLQKLDGLQLAYLAKYDDEEDDIVYMAVIAMLHIVDPETGEQVFSPDDLARLSKSDGSALSRISFHSTHLSRLKEELTVAAKNS